MHLWEKILYIQQSTNTKIYKELTKVQEQTSINGKKINILLKIAFNHMANIYMKNVHHQLIE